MARVAMGQILGKLGRSVLRPYKRRADEKKEGTACRAPTIRMR
jgi:hypothetical protein